MYISGVFVLVIFDSLLKRILWNNGSTLREYYRSDLGNSEWNIR